jgi:4-amino-4-deoxy-L-arabinose transferase-like glycosyltransferase
MLGLMLGPANRDSATVDETTVLGAGCTFWTGHRFYFMSEHPPLSPMLVTMPIVISMNLQMSPQAQALLNREAGYPWAVGWYGDVRPLQQIFPDGRNSWYFFALPEAQLFGQMFVYGSGNDADAMLFRARCVQMAFCLLVGVVIFVWVLWATENNLASLFALALWVFNPDALAYGHLASTGDIGVTLGTGAALLSFVWMLDRATLKAAAICGVATGIALCMKFTALVLGPIYVVLFALSWKRIWMHRRNMWKLFLAFAASVWAVLMLVYFPLWQTAPPLPEAQAAALPVPGWFQSLRPLLIPRDFFKGIALALNHSKGRHEDYLLGAWSQEGWWYYYPLAFFFKSPLAFVLLTAASAGLALKCWKSMGPIERIPWIAAGVYLLIAMSSHVNIGVRHLLPVFPLLCVGIGCAFRRIKNPVANKAAFILLGWQTLAAIFAYPLYIQYFSEAIGGMKNGQKYLIDSNYDWGQDAKRLKEFLEKRGINHIYLDYFGTQYNIEYLKIPNTRVNADQARQIKQGWLVVSASELMRPEWAWLRESRQPVERVAHTLFVYQID